MECVESGRRREDVAPVHWRVHQAGLQRWRPGRSTELQRPVRPDEIVRAAQEVDVPVELVGATGVAGRATAQVRRALANREVETLDERGVQGLGILRLPPRSLQPTRRADPPAPFDSDDAIVPPSLEHVTIDARRPKEALTHPNGVLEPLGRDQREAHHASAEDDVVEDGRGGSRGAAAEHAPGPQSGTHLDGRTPPCGSALGADERLSCQRPRRSTRKIAQEPPDGRYEPERRLCVAQLPVRDPRSERSTRKIAQEPPDDAGTNESERRLCVAQLPVRDRRVVCADPMNCKVALKQAQSRSTASCSISSAWVVSCRATYQEGLSRILHRFGVDEDQDLQEAAAPTPDRPAVPRRPGRAGHGPLKGSPSVAGFPTSEPQKSRGAGLSQPYGTTAKSEIRASLCSSGCPFAHTRCRSFGAASRRTG